MRVPLQRLLQYSFTIVVLLFIVSACTETTPKDTVQHNEHKSSIKKRASYQTKIDIVKPKVGSVITRGDSILIELKIIKDDRKIDSLEYFVNNTKVTLHNNKISSQDFKSGRNIITVKSYNNNNSTDKVVTHVITVLDHIPPTHKVKIINKFEHNVTAYTQGLIFENNYLYEGTGQYGESMLKKIDLEKNSLIQSYNLPKEVFGEGIVLHNKKIYQLSWRSQRAFVYDLKSFSLLHEFQYETEGWGITNYGENLIMSDGTQNLYIIEPESFSVLDKLQVTDNIGPIHNLNELEWINGKIWANVYLSNTIVIIDPKTGFVEKKLDLTDLVPSTFANANDNVLNGIAYDKEADKIYVTGKRWPILYEIKIIE